jgi:hypothetical protein
MSDEQFYAINASPHFNEDGHWVLLKGWMGCQAGQGNIIVMNLTNKEVTALLNKEKQIKEVYEYKSSG